MDQAKNISVLDLPIEGHNLPQTTLREQVSTQPTLLVFLRHFGCVFCRELVNDLRRITKEMPDYPPIIFFHQEDVDTAHEFFRKLWKEARSVADTEKIFYAAFGIEQANLRELAGPEVWMATLRAISKGNRIGKTTSDPRMMPGAFLMYGEEILWEYEFQHAGDHPDLRMVMDYLPRE